MSMRISLTFAVLAKFTDGPGARTSSDLAASLPAAPSGTDETAALAVEAYAYAYPLVLTELARRTATEIRQSTLELRGDEHRGALTERGALRV